VPDRCKIRLDRHTVVGEEKEEIRNDIKKIIATLDLKGICSLDWMERKTPFLEPYIIDVDSPWAKRFLSCYKEFFGKEADISYGKSVGDFNAFGKIMPTIVFGPNGENAHAPNECVYLDSVIRCRDFYRDFLVKKT
jgi:acetylornithine deacetylase/succinyl-diaminopimelate desuccinylase-like protein